MICILMGRSGSGKSAIAAKLIDNYGYKKIKGATTRKPREGETSDDYHFMDKETFLKRVEADEFVEWDKYGDNLYGTLRSELEKGGKQVSVLTPEGAAAVKKACPGAFIVLVDAATKTCVLRAVGREDQIGPENITRIADRAVIDYYLFDKNSIKKSIRPDLVIKNEDISLDRITEYIAAVHKTF